MVDGNHLKDNPIISSQIENPLSSSSFSVGDKINQNEEEEEIELHSQQEMRDFEQFLNHQEEISTNICENDEMKGNEEEDQMTLSSSSLNTQQQQQNDQLFESSFSIIPDPIISTKIENEKMLDENFKQAAKVFSFSHFSFF